MPAGVASEDAASLPYHEPGIQTILILVSFLLLLNAINAALDKVLYCGLLGQVLIGIVWGTPGAKWLSIEVEQVIVQLGYLGLVLLVYEGGLHTNFQSLRANLLLSSAVALTGICGPIALSYTLQGLLNATPVQAFAAGAALCSTSLGTTFTVLGSSGLSSSRLGVVLTSAAMMDDVVGLVMVQVISNLGGENFNAVTVVRPVLVSVAFAVAVPLACIYAVKPITLQLNRYRASHPTAPLSRLLCQIPAALTFHTAFLVALITAATFAGTSNLFAAYLAGAAISWWDSEVPYDVKTATEKASASASNAILDEAAGPSKQNTTTLSPEEAPRAENGFCGAAIYDKYYAQAVSCILQPLFFASIGFSIPITRMFRSAIVWRGVVYTVLMALAKMFCGLWLVRLPAPLATVRRLLKGVKLSAVPHLLGKTRSDVTAGQEHTGGAPGPSTTPPSSDGRRCSPNPPKPLSMHPPLILALAMCARGEIGFLISGVAESNGIFSPADASSDTPSDIFLVVTWAIMLCTIAGPLGVGLSVRRVKKLQERKNKQQDGAGRDVLGVWGIE